MSDLPIIGYKTKRKREQIDSVALKLGYHISVQEFEDGARVRYNVSERGPISIWIEFLHIDEVVNIWAHVRSSSWDFAGERTDIHDMLSTLLAVFFRVFSCNISSSLSVVPNPVTGINSEIYARYLILSQPFASSVTLNDLVTNQIENILTDAKAFEYMFWDWFDWPLCECDTCRSKPQPPYRYDAQSATPWARTIADAINEEFDDAGVQFNSRFNPTWKYYRSVNSKLSVVFAPTAITHLADIVQDRNTWTTISGINGRLFVSGETRNIVSFKSISLARHILEKIEAENDRLDLLDLIPLENHLVVIGKSHLLFIEHDCGARRFEKEKERIRRRHVQETHFLFKNSFVWAEPIDGNSFELLILEILRRESGVKWIRKVSSGNEPDNGRDLIAEWQTGPIFGEHLKEDKNPYTQRRIVIQCKALKKGVGKSDVSDIRDTIDHHDANGYVLIVSSRLTTTLTTHLEKLRYGGKYWIDWWTRTEIEDRLAANPDILARFSSIVRSM